MSNPIKKYLAGIDLSRADQLQKAGWHKCLCSNQGWVPPAKTGSSLSRKHYSLEEAWRLHRNRIEELKAELSIKQRNLIRPDGEWKL